MITEILSGGPRGTEPVTNAWATRLKLHIFAYGLSITPEATATLTDGSMQPLTLHEYATTGGVTIKIDDMYVNAPFDDWYCGDSEAELRAAPDGTLSVRFADEEHSCEVLPLPGYVDATNRLGSSVIATTMSHADRVRVSPLAGCVLDCSFCDMPSVRYQRHAAEDVLASLQVACSDQALPVAHALISGGSPGPRHVEWWDDCVETIISRSPLPIDLMMSPRAGDRGFVQRFVDAGVSGFSFNLEIAGNENALRLMPRKFAESTPYFEATVAEGVRLMGAGTGAVRSIVLVGLDETEITVAAVEAIARLGADPVLSPFRPAQKTQLESWRPPSVEVMDEVWERSSAIAERYGVALGPRCIPCQHNTLTFPGAEGYYYSADRGSR